MRKVGIRLHFGLLVILGLGILAGCGSDGLATVEGKVTLDGAPLVGAQVALFPVDVKDRRAYVGITDESGHYSLKAGGNPGLGVPAGDYDLSISTAVIVGPSDEMTKAPPERVPVSYRDRSMKFTVPPGGKTDANFDIKSR